MQEIFDYTGAIQTLTSETASVVNRLLFSYIFERRNYFRQLRCTRLNETLKHIIILQQSVKEDEEETIADFLLFRNHNEETIIRNRDDLYKIMETQKQLFISTILRNLSDVFRRNDETLKK